MGKDSKIGWTDHTWNPIIGCHKVSPGCKFCYAERLVKRTGKDFREIRRAGDKTFYAPRKWKEPAKVFTCSLSDIFIEEADRFRNEIFEIIWENPHLTFQVLTKRIERVNRRLLSLYWPSGNPMAIPPNIWIGTSVENQEMAEKRIPELIFLKRCYPDMITFLSCEPLIGPLELFNFSEGVLDGVAVIKDGGVTPSTPNDPPEGYDSSYSGIDWVITGGESGPASKIRSANIDWFRSIRDQCITAGVPYFHKQNGGSTKRDLNGKPNREGEWGGRSLDGRTWEQFPNFEILENFQS